MNVWDLSWGQWLKFAVASDEWAKIQKERAK